MEIFIEAMLLEALAIAMKLAITQFIQWLSMRTMSGVNVAAA